MQLVIPGLADLPRADKHGVAIYGVGPDATFEVYPLVALPVDVAAWGPTVTGASEPRVRIVRVIDKHTELGWPAMLAESTILDEAFGAIVEHRLHVLYRFLEYGGIAVVRARDARSFSDALDLIVPLLPHGRPDFAGDEVVALAQIWAYL